MSETENHTETPANDQADAPADIPADPPRDTASEADTAPVAAAGQTEAENAAVDPAATIADLEARLIEAEDKMMRAVAEAENARRAARRDVENAAAYSTAKFARDLLDVSDNLRRALESVPTVPADGDAALKSFHEGVAMTEKALLAAFERNGIEKITPELGEKLDPNRHQAMFEIPVDTLETGTVGQVMAPGYVLKDRLLRAAMVGVVKNVPKPEGAGPDDRPGSHFDASA